jgi:DNA primase
MRTWIDFRELRAKLKFEQVLRHYGVEPKLNSDQHLGICPLPGHGGKKDSPSFSANLTRGIWQCFGCKGKGNILDFCVRMENLDPENGQHLRDVALKLKKQFLAPGEKDSPEPKRAAPASRAVQQEIHEQSASEPAVRVNAPLDFELKGLDSNHASFRMRGLSKETIERFGLGLCTRGFLKDRIAVPLHDNGGALVGYAGRVIDDSTVTAENPKYILPTTREHKGTTFKFDRSLLCYNAHRIGAPVERLIVVEETDSVWWLFQKRHQNVVALMGETCSEKQTEIMLSKVMLSGSVIIFTGSDPSGETFATELFRRIAPHRFVRWLKILDRKLPTDAEPNELNELLRLESETAPRFTRSARSIKARLMVQEISSRSAIVELANSFPALTGLQIRLNGWDATKLDMECSKLSPSGRASVQFVLSVWDPRQEWLCGSFDVVQALDLWDSEHRAAFVAWATDPWWV